MVFRSKGIGQGRRDSESPVRMAGKRWSAHQRREQCEQGELQREQGPLEGSQKGGGGDTEGGGKQLIWGEPPWPRGIPSLPIPHRPEASFSPHSCLPTPNLIRPSLSLYSILTQAAGLARKQFGEWLMERVGTWADDSELPCLLCWANSLATSSLSSLPLL